MISLSGVKINRLEKHLASGHYCILAKEREKEYYLLALGWDLKVKCFKKEINWCDSPAAA